MGGACVVYKVHVVGCWAAVLDLFQTEREVNGLRLPEAPETSRAFEALQEVKRRVEAARVRSCPGARRGTGAALPQMRQGDHATHEHRLTHKQASQAVELECWKCAECGELVMHGAATLKFSATLQELKRRVAIGEAHNAR